MKRVIKAATDITEVISKIKQTSDELVYLAEAFFPHAEYTIVNQDLANNKISYYFEISIADAQKPFVEAARGAIYYISWANGLDFDFDKGIIFCSYDNVNANYVLSSIEELSTPVKEVISRTKQWISRSQAEGINLADGDFLGYAIYEIEDSVVWYLENYTCRGYDVDFLVDGNVGRIEVSSKGGKFPGRPISLEFSLEQFENATSVIDCDRKVLDLQDSLHKRIRKAFYSRSKRYDTEDYYNL